MTGTEILTILTWLLVCGGVAVAAGMFASKMHKRFWTSLLEPYRRSTVADVEELRLKDKAEARAAYERVILAKLEVMKTAVVMGFNDSELKALDQRLEALVGSDKVAGLVDPVATQALPSAELLDVDLQREVAHIRELQQSAKTDQ